MDPSTIELLLAGDPSNGYSIGIIQFCGKQKNAENTTYSPSHNFEGYQYKESVKLALALWVYCIHESYGNHYKSFQNELKKISMGVYIQARLDIHIQIKEMQEYAGVLIDAILFATDFKLNQILPNPSAQESFKKWIKEKQGIDFKDKNQQQTDDGDDDDEVIISSNNKKKKATKWEEVKEEDLIIDGNAQQQNDEWFETLDFVGRRNKVGGDDIKHNDDDLLDDEEDDNDDEDAYIFDDPLGQKKRYHVRKRIDAFNKKKKLFFDLRIERTNDINDIIDTYYQYSPCITYENFNATNFLVEIHNETDFDELQNGLDKIEKFVRDQSHKMKELVSEHFDEFVYCKDTIDSIHKMLKNNDNSGNMLVNSKEITKRLLDIDSNACNIYGNVLQRTKKAKILYETLQLIKQPSFKFLFTLPQTIKYHIMMRNYDQIIRIYKRVNALKSQINQNNLLNKILFELNNTIKTLKEDLLLKLSQSDCDTFSDEQERIILYLIQLDCDTNPATYFLKQRHKSIIIKLNESQPSIKKLCQCFISDIPSFWKLSKSIIESKFTKDNYQNTQENKPKKIKKDYENEKIVKQLFGEITNKFINSIELAVNLNEKHKKKSHSKEILKFLLSAYGEIKSIGINPYYLYGIDHLISQIVESFLNNLFEKSLKYILSTLCIEKWKPHRDIPGVTTTPLIFSDHISKTLQIVVDIGIKTMYDADDQYTPQVEAEIDDESDEDEYIPFRDDISSMSDDDDINNNNNNNNNIQLGYSLNALWLVPLIGSYFIESHKIFADCLHELISLRDVDGDDENVNNNKINILSNYSDKSSDKKLLYILGNTIYTKETILERIWTKYIKKSGIIGIEYISILESSKNNLIDLYNSLEQMVFDKYVRCKTLLLNRVIDNSLLCDGINWETLSEIKGIRNHCLQLLLHFVFIHNEVYNSSKQELDNVLISLLEKVSDHLLSTIKQIDSFSPNGALQILIEIDFIRNTLSKYLQADGSQIVFQQIKQLLYQWIDQDHNIIQKRKQQLTLHTKQSTVVMFSCFSYEAKA